MSGKTTTLLLMDRLVNMQATLHDICRPNPVVCVTDQRYIVEWEVLRDFVDTVVSTMTAALGSTPDDPTTWQTTPYNINQWLLNVLKEIVPAAEALQEGYLYALAECEEGDACGLRERALAALAYREQISNQ